MGPQMVGLVDEARNAGVDVTYDQYPYAAASTILHSLLPYWVHTGGPAALLARIKDRAVRDEIGDAVEPMWGLTLDSYIFSNIGSARNKEWEGRSLAELARHQGKRMVDAICDLLIGRKPGGGFRSPNRQPRQHPRRRRPPGADGRLRRAAHRRSAQPAHLRHLSLCAGPVRAGRGAAAAGGRRAADDGNAGPAAGGCPTGACCGTE